MMIWLIAAEGAQAPATTYADVACPPEVAALAPQCAVIERQSPAENLRYEVYRLADEESAGGIFDAPPYNATGVSVFLNEDVEPAWIGAGYIGESWFETPSLTENAYGRMLVIRQKYSGTASFISDHVFLFDGTSLKALAPTVDLESGEGVIAELSRRLPDGLAIWKGVAIDYASMTGSSALWRPEDANCCPSGGTVEFSLRLSDDGAALVVQDFHILTPAEDE